MSESGYGWGGPFISAPYVRTHSLWMTAFQIRPSRMDFRIAMSTAFHCCPLKGKVESHEDDSPRSPCSPMRRFRAEMLVSDSVGYRHANKYRTAACRRLNARERPRSPRQRTAHTGAVTRRLRAHSRTHSRHTARRPSAAHPLERVEVRLFAGLDRDVRPLTRPDVRVCERAELPNRRVLAGRREVAVAGRSH